MQAPKLPAIIGRFTSDQIGLIKRQIAPRATDDELALFLYVSHKTGLDPMTRQIYCIHRNVKEDGQWIPKMTIQTSIDGFRVIAMRTGDYAGQSEPEFTEKDGRLIRAKVVIYKFRGDTRYEAAVGLAYWDEYAPYDKDNNPSGMWRKMPHVMLAKCAEAVALRKAFPQDLSSLYTEDEMDQADIEALKPKEGDGVTLDGLHEKYLQLLEEYKAFKGADEAKKFHPDNWKSKVKGVEQYTYAIASLEVRLNEEKTKTQTSKNEAA